MKKLALKSTFALLVSAFALQASAQDTPKVLEAPLKAGMKVVTKFQAAGSLQGWVLSQNGQNSVVYTTADGKLLIAGALIDESGTNLTAQYAEKHIPKPEYDKLMPKLEKSAYIVTGAKGNAAKSTIYVFTDLNCGYCALTYKAFLPYESVGLQIRWVPVGVLRADSLTKAAALLESPNAEAMMRAHKLGFGKDASAGIKPAASVSDALQKKLEANTALMREFNFNGTPGIVYKDKNGKAVTNNGMPRLSNLPSITGLPSQTHTDPDLARFK